jgi:galactose mutarotase-like enzyme
MSSAQLPLVSLGSGELTARIDPLGAQLTALVDSSGRDLLWDGDPAVWSGRAPLLFPIVGELAGGRYRLGDRSFALPRHGFARRSVFAVVASTADRALFRLQADPASRALYPFEFELDVEFTVRGSSLTIAAVVKNTGPSPLPASFGFHPALRWPLPYGQPRAAHTIEFAADEPAAVRRLDAHGLLDPKPQPTPILARRLALADPLFTNDVVILDQVQSRFVTYGADSGPRIRVSFPDAPYLGLWTKPGAQFICIEPWHGIADPEGYTGDFTAKPGIFSVAPGADRTIEMTLTLLH